MKIDFEIINNKEKYYTMCDQLFSEYQGPDWWVVWQGEWPLYKDNYYENLHFENIEPPKEDRQRQLGSDQRAREVSDKLDQSFLYGENPTPTTSVLDRVVIEKDHPLHKQICKDLDLSHARILLNLQQPGTHVPPHLDRNAAFVNSVLEDRPIHSWYDLKRYIYMWEDQKFGEFFRIGDSYFTWKAGDCIEFPFFMMHATANAGHDARPSLSIVGVKNESHH